MNQKEDGKINKLKMIIIHMYFTSWKKGANILRKQAAVTAGL